MRKKTTLILALIVSIATLSNAQNDTIFNKDFNDQDISSGGWTSELVSGPDNCAWDIFISENSAARISLRRNHARYLLAWHPSISALLRFLHIGPAYRYAMGPTGFLRPQHNHRLLILCRSPGTYGGI